MIPADAGDSETWLSPHAAPQSRTADAQAEAEERARYLRARLAQLHAAYLEERTGVLPPLAIPRPTSLNVEESRPLDNINPQTDSDNNAHDTSDWSHVSVPTGTVSTAGESEFSVVGRSTIEDMGDLTLADTDSAVSINALSVSEASALSASSRLARTNADAARYYDAYRSARLDAVEAQLARRNLSRTLAQRDAENNTLKAILQLHTMSRHLRDSEAVLDAARKVFHLQDEMASQQKALRMLMEAKKSAASNNDGASTFNARRDSKRARRTQRTSPTETQSHMGNNDIEDAAWQTYLKAKNHASMEGRTPTEVVDAILASSAITKLDSDRATLLSQNEVVLELIRLASVEAIGDTVEAHFHQAQTMIWNHALRIACAVPGLICSTDPMRVREMVQGQCPELADPPCQCNWKRITALLRSYGLKLQFASIEAVTRNIMSTFPEIASSTSVARAWIQSRPDEVFADVPFFIDPDNVKALLLSGKIKEHGPAMQINGMGAKGQGAMRAVPVTPKRDIEQAVKIDDTRDMPNKRSRASTATTSVPSGDDKSADAEVLAHVSQADIEASVNGYAKLREEASTMLEALFARHKVLAQDLCDEAALQEKGFYRLTRAQLEAVNEYPQIVVLDGETYAMSMPLESTASGGAVNHKGKGKAHAPAEEVSGLVTNDLEAFRKAWKDELGVEKPLTEQLITNSSYLFDSASDTDTEVPDEGFASDCFEEV